LALQHALHKPCLHNLLYTTFNNNHIDSSHKQSIPSRMQSILSRMQRIPSHMQRIPSRMQRIPSRMQRIPSHMQRIPSHMQRIPSRMQRIPSRMQRIPSRIDLYDAIWHPQKKMPSSFGTMFRMRALKFKRLLVRS